MGVSAYQGSAEGSSDNYGAYARLGRMQTRCEVRGKG